MADKNEQDPGAAEDQDAQRKAAADADADAEAAAKAMVGEGAPPPEHARQAFDSDEGDSDEGDSDEAVTIEVIPGDTTDGDASGGESPDIDSAGSDAAGSDAAGSDAAGDVELDPLEELRLKLAEAEAKADEYLDKMQRTAAEFQNSRRRQEKQMADEIQRANGQLIKRLLPVLDDFGLAFQNVPADLGGAQGDAAAAEDSAEQAWVDGFRQIQKKLGDTLTEQGLEMIPATGEFDPTLHEAISSEPSDTVESGHIIQTLRAGYIYKGQVIRPALIRVAA